MTVFLVTLCSIEAVALAGLAGWLLRSALRSSEFDAEEQERAMFRALAAVSCASAPQQEPVDVAPVAACCPEMPDLARLGAALAQAEAKTHAETRR